MGGQKRQGRKAQKVRKAVVGMSLDEIKRKAGESRGDRDQALATATAEVKARKQKAAAKKAEKAKFAKTATAAVKNAPKQKVQKGGKRRTCSHSMLTPKALLAYSFKIELTQLVRL